MDNQHYITFLYIKFYKNGLVCSEVSKPYTEPKKPDDPCWFRKAKMKVGLPTFIRKLLRRWISLPDRNSCFLYHEIGGRKPDNDDTNADQF